MRGGADRRFAAKQVCLGRSSETKLYLKKETMMGTAKGIKRVTHKQKYLPNSFDLLECKINHGKAISNSFPLPTLCRISGIQRSRYGTRW
jgi:hypothetical protein